MCILKLSFDMNHPYVPNEEDILKIINASLVYEIIESDSKISEVVVPNVSLSQVWEAMATLSIFLEQQQSNVSELWSKLLSIQKSIIIFHI